eukprot:Platyproteum_vivax@DN7482_c0_g2_i1.p2
MEQPQQTPVMMYTQPGQPMPEITPTAAPAVYYQQQEAVAYPTVQPEGGVYMMQEGVQYPQQGALTNRSGVQVVTQMPADVQPQVYQYGPDPNVMPVMEQAPVAQSHTGGYVNNGMYEMPAVGHPNPIYGMQPGGTPMPLTIDPAAAATTEGPYGQVVMYPPVVYPIVPPQENIKPVGTRSLGAYTAPKKRRNCC